MNTQAIAIILMIAFILAIFIADIYRACTGKNTVDKKHSLKNIVNELMSVHGNPLGIYKSSVNNVAVIEGEQVNKFVIGYAKSPKYGYDITTIYNYPEHILEVTFGIPRPDGQFGSVTRQTWTVREALIGARYYLDHLEMQVRIWEEEFHRVSQDGTDNETDR